MSLRRGEVVLVPFPFTDLTAQKVRPAVVVSADNSGEDILVAFISSAPPQNPPSATELLVFADHPEFSETGLKKPSVIKAVKLLSLHKSKILRRLGRLGPLLSQELDLRLKRALGI